MHAGAVDQRRDGDLAIGYIQVQFIAAPVASVTIAAFLDG